jgi:hypothetical protein
MLESRRLNHAKDGRHCDGSIAMSSSVVVDVLVDL